jgi:hypothetical protein
MIPTYLAIVSFVEMVQLENIIEVVWKKFANYERKGLLYNYDKQY